MTHYCDIEKASKSLNIRTTALKGFYTQIVYKTISLLLNNNYLANAIGKRLRSNYIIWLKFNDTLSMKVKRFTTIYLGTVD